MAEAVCAAPAAYRPRRARDRISYTSIRRYFNGDGYADLIVGSPLYSGGRSGEGRVSVFLGKPGFFPAVSGLTAEPSRPVRQEGD